MIPISLPQNAQAAGFFRMLNNLAKTSGAFLSYLEGCWRDTYLVFQKISDSGELWPQNLFLYDIDKNYHWLGDYVKVSC